MEKNNIDKHKLRKMNKNRKIKTEASEREHFLFKMKQTFWAVQPSYESQMKKSQQQEIQGRMH